MIVLLFICTGFVLQNAKLRDIICDGTFTGNILIVGRIGFRKTYVTQKLALNRFFDKLKRVEWVS